MTAITINRAFNNTTNLISAAKEKSSHFAYGVKKFFYNLITLGFGKSMETARDERRENEIVHVAFDVLRSLPKDHTDLEKPEFKSKTLHTNFDKKYQIIQEGKDLCLYTGNVSQSPLNGKNNFDKDENSRMLLKTFSKEADLSTFTNELEPVKDNTIYKSLVEQQQQQAATKIQAGVRGLQSRINQKQQDKYGFKKLEYTSKNSNTHKSFLFSKNLNSFTVPKAKIKNGAKGAFKQVIAKDEHSVLFNRSNHLDPNIKELQHPWSSHDIEKVLNTLGITTFKVTHQISQTQEIAHNAGPDDLYTGYVQKSKTIGVEYFKPVLLDMKKLHSSGYFYLDAKSNNIQVKMTNDKPVLSVIDLDSFSSLNKYSKLAGTPSFITGELSRKCFPFYYNLVEGGIKKNTEPKITDFQTADEFAFIVTMLESNGDYDASESLMDKTGLELDNKISNFINKNIKPEYKDQFIALITRPGTYAEKYLDNKPPVYLVDMLI